VIGIVRVSQVKGREGQSFASPGQQRDRIHAACERDGLVLLDVMEELDVSGGRPLDARPGLSRAVAAVEAGEADVIVAGYFDRLVRSLRVQDELVTRVESAVHRPVNPTILTPEEFAASSGFLDNVRSGSAVAVIGELPWH